MSKVNMAVDLGGVKMQNPINTASGCFGYGNQFEPFFDVSRLGAITTKGCSAVPWDGNPAPRWNMVFGWGWACSFQGQIGRASCRERVSSPV